MKTIPNLKDKIYIKIKPELIKLKNELIKLPSTSN